MDKLEFSIAMKLIKLKLQGVALPLTLPMSMRQQPALSISGIGMYRTVMMWKNSFSNNTCRVELCHLG